MIEPLNFDIVSELVEVLPLTPNYDIPKVEFYISRVTPDQITNDSLKFYFQNKIDFNTLVDYSDKILLGSDLDGKPLKYFWNTTLGNNDSLLYPDQSIWKLYVSGYDSNNNRTDSDEIFIMVDNSESNPTQINLTSVQLNTDGNFNIDWIKSEDEDFLKYVLYKSSNNNFQNMDTIFQTYDVSDTSYIDTLINPLIFQYYKLAVIDTFGYYTLSDILSSSLDAYPNEIVIENINYDYNAMTVSWGSVVDTDLEEIKLLFSNDNIVVEDLNEDNIIFSTYDLDIRSFTILDSINFDPTIENWFWIMSIDTFDQSTIGPGKSNEVNLPPIQSNISNINFNPNEGEFEIEWIINEEEDFYNYKLFESDDYDMLNEIEIFSTTNNEINFFNRSGIMYGEQKYYKIEIEDGWFQKTYSDLFIGNSNYWFNQKYDITTENSNQNYNDFGLQVIPIESVDKFLISGYSELSSYSGEQYWYSLVDSLGNFINDDLETFGNPDNINKIKSMIEMTQFSETYVYTASIGDIMFDNVKIEKIYYDGFDNLIPSESFLSSDHFQDCGFNKNCVVSKIISLDESNILSVGYMSDNNINDIGNLWMFELNSNLEYNQKYMIDENQSSKANDVIEDQDNIILVGSYLNNNGNEDVMINKYNKYGDSFELSWTMSWGNSSLNDEGKGIANGIDDYVIIVNSDENINILKLDKSGIYEPELMFEINNAVANKIIKLNEGYALVGYKIINNSHKNVFVAKFYINDLEPIWERDYGCYGDDIGYDIKETFEGGAGLGGLIIGATLENNNDFDAWLIKTNHLGITNDIICD